VYYLYLKMKQYLYFLKHSFVTFFQYVILQ